MDFKITATMATARAALETEYASPPAEHAADVAMAIDDVMDCVNYGAKLIYNEYLNLALTITD